MQFQENKNKFYQFWNRIHKSEDDLNYISLKEEGIGKDLTIPKQTVNKKINYYTTEWENAEVENNGTGTIQGYFKLWNVTINNFPINLIPFIKTSQLYTSDTNEKIMYDVLINQEGIKNFTYFTVMNSGDVLIGERKDIKIQTGFEFKTSEPNDFKIFQCKLIIAIYNPYSFS